MGKLVAEIHLPLTSSWGKRAPSMSVVPGEPQLSLPLTPGLEDHEPCTARSLHVWPIRGDLVVGGPMEMSLMSQQLIGCLVRVSWRGSGAWQRAEGTQSPLTLCGFHYPAGLFAPEQCQRQRNRIH